MSLFFELFIVFCFEDTGVQVKFFGHLHCPLLAEIGGCNDEDTAFAFSPFLGNDQPGFNGFAEAYFVGKNRAFG